MIEHLFTADAMIALLTLTFLEIVLGIDYIHLYCHWQAP